MCVDNVVRVDYTILTLVADENGQFGMDIRSNNLALVVCYIEPGGPTDRLLLYEMFFFLATFSIIYYNTHFSFLLEPVACK